MSRGRVVEADVKGEVVEATVTGVANLAPATRMRIRSVLADTDTLHVDADAWYPLEDHLTALQRVEDAVGRGVLRRIGAEVPNVVASCTPAPPGAVLRRLDDAYQAYHRGDDVGGYAVDETGCTTVRVTSTSPYPDDVDYGVVEGACERYALYAYPTVDPGEGYGDPETATTFEVRW